MLRSKCRFISDFNASKLKTFAWDRIAWSCSYLQVSPVKSYKIFSKRLWSVHTTLVSDITLKNVFIIIHWYYYFYSEVFINNPRFKNWIMNEMEWLLIRFGACAVKSLHKKELRTLHRKLKLFLHKDRFSGPIFPIKRGWNKSSISFGVFSLSLSLSLLLASSPPSILDWLVIARFG